ncbi:family 32 glycosyltransferase [Pseudomassariella vexata]|uniref:Family 32 glycosyltransferase n=1 Tax=Pseudomassariella vexata TaxID=1141098 RepID=A0A1Y2EH39_9PEZI|nr:family 32 glycosyltransferase [Pseudomassariella vexata]ORY70890.1 family 32 glycosyltransferase [Pseudomassariella vexata]
MMNSPLSPLSPRLASSTAKLRNRVPTQVRRLIPIYALCLCIILVILNADILPSPHKPNVFKRRAASLKPLKGHDGTGFPKKIWQSWKTDPFSFEARDLNTARTWTLKNPEYRYEVLTDYNDLGYVEEHFGPGGFNRMDIVEMYRTVNATIIKADLLRYLIMYAEGGVYADIDVEDLRPVRKFIPERYDEADIDMVIGIEIDQPDFKDHPILGKKSQSFCQWTFMAKPRQPVMLKLVENIMAWLNDISYQQGVPVGEIVLSFDEVISGTGPSAFTIAMLEDMNKNNHGPKITWQDFHELDESKVVSRILVQNVEVFAAGQGHSDSGNHNSRGALVKHHYHASNWPSRHARFAHPVYGEVERCNWNVECVKKWDADVAAFAELSPEEQQQKMAEPKPDLLAPGFPALPAFPPAQLPAASPPAPEAPDLPIIPELPAAPAAPAEIKV